MGEFIVYVPDRSTLLPVHGAEAPRVKEPLKDLGATLAERIDQALLDSSAEAVQRNAKSGDTNF
jgi:hypothetical protein